MFIRLGMAFAGTGAEVELFGLFSDGSSTKRSFDTRAQSLHTRFEERPYGRYAHGDNKGPHFDPEFKSHPLSHARSHSKREIRLTSPIPSMKPDDLITVSDWQA